MLAIILICIFCELFCLNIVYCQPIPPKFEGIDLIQTVVNNKNSFNYSKTASYNYMNNTGITNYIFNENITKYMNVNLRDIKVRMVWLNMFIEFNKYNVSLLYHNHVFLQFWCDSIDFHVNYPFTHHYLIQDNFIQWQININKNIENQYLTNNVTLSNRGLDLYKDAKLEDKPKLMYLKDFINDEKFIKTVLKLKYGS